MKSWPEKNGLEMYSTHNDGKSVVAERFIRTLKNKIYKYMTSISRNAYIDKLNVICDLKGEKIVGMFYKKELQKPNQKEFRAEKVIKKKSINYMLNGKATIVLLTVGLIKVTLYKWVNIFQNQNL